MIRMISFRFIMKRQHVPPAVLMQEKEPKAKTQRVGYVDRKPALPSTENCSLQKVSLDGYVLVDAFCHKAPNPKGPADNFVAHFRFAKSEFSEVSNEFAALAPALLEAFEQLCATAFWGTEVHVNPFFQDEIEVPGQKMAAFSLNKRVPRSKPDGTLELRWRKDEAGERIGDRPVPLWPDYYVFLEGEKLSLQPGE